MSVFTANGQTFRYRDIHLPGDLNHCYRSDCQDIGKPLVDFIARWENVGEVDETPADAVLYTCADHQGKEFEEAKRSFSSTQKTGSAAYLTKDDIRRNSMR